MRKIGFFIFCLSNIYLAGYYIKDIIRYLAGNFNYDGMRHLVPLAIADALFIVALILIFVLQPFNKSLFYFLGLAIMHNLAVGFGIERLPFIGIATATISIILSIRWTLKT